ncbi:hypothetical protein [Aquamicrobium soli]|uniref:Antifreeze protein n=1 Tax=Aquamicrobium soli TaxID=1811518 RepID=A0ABV7KKB4_9HYPH
MHKFITSAALALTVALTGMPLTFGTATAQDVQLYLGQDGPRMRMRDDCDPYREDCRGYGDRYRDAQRFYRGCTPERALYKAERMGIRRARIVDVGRRTIDVVGRSRYGNRVVVTFDRRDRRCGVIG